MDRVVITREMIEAGAQEVDRLVNWDIDSPAWVGPYTAELIAKTVFDTMLASRPVQCSNLESAVPTDESR